MSDVEIPEEMVKAGALGGGKCTCDACLAIARDTLCGAGVPALLARIRALEDALSEKPEAR